MEEANIKLTLNVFLSLDLMNVRNSTKGTLGTRTDLTLLF